jgi:hypothetical protein
MKHKSGTTYEDNWLHSMRLKQQIYTHENKGQKKTLGLRRRVPLRKENYFFLLAAFFLPPFFLAAFFFGAAFLFVAFFAMVSCF